MTAYDPRNLSWDTWCSLMAELFAAQQLGVVPEENWRDWGNGLAGNGYFERSGAPSTQPFDTWQDWAQQLVGILSVEQ